MPSFVIGATLNLSLGANDVVTFAGTGQMALTISGGITTNSYISSQSQILGPYGVSTTIVINCYTAGSYTQVTLPTGSGSSGSSDVAQSITFANMSAVANLSLGNIINVSDPVTADVTIHEPINPVVGLVIWNWQQDTTGGRTITLPNGTTISGGLPSEFQSAVFFYNGTNYMKLANG